MWNDCLLKGGPGSLPSGPAPVAPHVRISSSPNARGASHVSTKSQEDSSRPQTWAAWTCWKGGPPLRGEPGSPEFVASYNEAVAAKVTPPNGVLLNLLQDYQASDNFRSRRDRTPA